MKKSNSWHKSSRSKRWNFDYTCVSSQVSPFPFSPSRIYAGRMNMFVSMAVRINTTNGSGSKFKWDIMRWMYSSKRKHTSIQKQKTRLDMSWVLVYDQCDENKIYPNLVTHTLTTQSGKCPRYICLNIDRFPSFRILVDRKTDSQTWRLDDPSEFRSPCWTTHQNSDHHDGNSRTSWSQTAGSDMSTTGTTKRCGLVHSQLGDTPPRTVTQDSPSRIYKQTQSWADFVF